MDSELNADEILQIAEDIERNGKAFYASAAAIAKDNNVKKLFLELAEWEARHQKTFKDMRLSIGRAIADALLLDPGSEEGLYLKAAADGHVFTSTGKSPEILLREAGGKVGALLSFAIEREKDSVVFYTAISRATRDEVTREAVDKIVGEEISHIRFLSAMFATVDR